MHPGEKAVALFGLLALAISLPPIPALPLITAVILALAWAAGVPWGLYLSRVAAPAAFIALGIGPLIFALTPGGLILIPGGVGEAGRVLGRCIVGMGAMMLFALTTPMASQIELLRTLRTPESIVHVIVLIYRMIGTLMLTARTMWDAQAARLGHSGWRRWINSVGQQAASLFVLSLVRARSLEEGLELRADPGASRVLTDTAAPRVRVLVAGVVMLAAIAGLSLWRSHV